MKEEFGTLQLQAEWIGRLGICEEAFESRLKQEVAQRDPLLGGPRMRWTVCEDLGGSSVQGRALRK